MDICNTCGKFFKRIKESITEENTFEDYCNE